MVREPGAFGFPGRRANPQAAPPTYRTPAFHFFAAITDNADMTRLPAVSFVVFLIASLVGPPASHGDDDQQQQWEQLPNLPSPVLAASISRDEKRVYLSGGIAQLGQTQKIIQVFDLEAMQWKLPLEMKTPRAMHAQVTLKDGRLFIAGGQTGAVKPVGDGLKATNTCELIGPKTGKATDVEAMSKPVAEPTAHVTSDGYAVVVGGKFARVFDPHRNEWRRSVALHHARQAHTSVMLDNDRILVIGGLRSDSIELVDTRAGLSRMMAAKLPAMMDDLAAVALPDGRVWILGGQYFRTGDTTDRTFVVDLSDPDKSTIKEGPSLKVKGGVADARIVTLGSHAVLIGGESQQSGRDTELRTARLLDLRTLEVTELPDTFREHDDAMAIAHDDGAIIFGGFVESDNPIKIRGLPSRIPVAVPNVERWRLKK